MATIQSQLRLHDGMTSALRSVTAALDTCLYSFEEMQAASGRAMNLDAIADARARLSEANSVIEEMEGNLAQVEGQQNKVNRSFQAGYGAADGLLGKVAQMAAAYVSLQGIQKVAGLSDTMASTQARLELIVDDGGSVTELQAEIMAMANRSRASFQDTADVIAKLGLQAQGAFSNNAELVRFAELMNKNFVVAGSSASEASSAMYQLTQAMSAGKLQGDEYRSIVENAPLLANAIESYLRASGVEGTMKEWAAEGLLTAEVIKNALFSSADEVEARFAEMPLTWEQAWTTAKNNILTAVQPLLDWIGQGAQWIADNWNQIAPILTPVVVAIGAVSAALGVVTAAQWAFNAALWASPLTWVVVLILAIIGLVYGAVAAVNHFSGATTSATGVIAGAFSVVGAVIGNILGGLWNLVVDVFVAIYNFVATIANFFGSIFNDPIGAIMRLFVGLADFVLSILQALASAIDFVFGSNHAGSVQGWRDGMNNWVEGTFGKGNEVMQKMNADGMKFQERSTYSGAWRSGYQAGDSFDSTIEGLFDMSALGGTVPPLSSAPPPYEAEIKGIEENTGSTAASLKNMSEDLVYMRDVAEREAINRFTTAEIQVDMTGMTNRIDSDMDVDGVIDRFVDGVTEAMAVAAEGVHQ